MEKADYWQLWVKTLKGVCDEFGVAFEIVAKKGRPSPEAKQVRDEAKRRMDNVNVTKEDSTVVVTPTKAENKPAAEPVPKKRGRKKKECEYEKYHTRNRIGSNDGQLHDIEIGELDFSLIEKEDVPRFLKKDWR